MDAQRIDAYVRKLGLKPAFIQAWMNTAPERTLFRVATVERGLCSVLSMEADGNVLESDAQPGAEAVAVGDWVILEAQREPARIAHVLERASWLRRGSAHQEGGEQLIAANLDTVFVVVAFAETEKLERRSLRARRLDRFISAVAEGGATPVVVLNKSDLAQRDPQALCLLQQELSQRLGGVDVVSASALDAQGLAGLAAWIRAGETLAFVGPSGVGKSSLINRLLGAERQTVGEVRARDTKGRHTTTRRELVLLPDGALLVDTPGVREFAVLADERVAGFADIDELAAECRFADCAHDSEPGCAVRAAVERGEVAGDRLQSYRDIERDAQRLRSKHDPYSRHLERAAGRRFGRLARTLIDRKEPR